MKDSATTPLKGLVRTLLAVLLLGASGSWAQAAQSTPVLLSNSTSTRAIALELTSMRPEPIPLSTSVAFGTDTRTRITLFAINLDLISGEGASALTADAEDAAYNRYAMVVEYVGQVPPDLSYPAGAITTDFRGVYMIVLRLNDAMGDVGDVLIRLNLHGVSSNRVRVGIGHIGGGPADDLGAVPTPAPATPPAMVVPQTVVQYQAQFANAGPASGPYPDGLRFLEQATWGPTDADLQHLRDIGMQAYLNEQFGMAPVFPSVQSDYPGLPLYPINQPVPCDAVCLRDNYTLYLLQRQFFTNALTQPDQLRQRVAFALHKLIVVGGRELNNNEASWYAPYLQTLDRNAFGNFRTLLYEVTLNPGMGEYLNMRGNSVGSRSNPTPNENYAREIMQLFSIGVDMLNQDGTPILDSQGNRIPSYDQATIANLARVFTGWDLGPNKITNINGIDTAVTNYLDPMVLNGNSNRYDIALKTLLPDINHATPLVLPACTNCTGGSGAQNLANSQAYKAAELGGTAQYSNGAIDNLFNHPNTGPYICGQLIHQLVTSNPTPPYVGRCAAVFANNGAGVRGDMKAVITSILLDPEARGDVKNDPNYGHLREPVLLITNLLRTFNATSDGVLATNNSGAGSFTSPLGQDLFNPPTVFSYFPADYGLPGTNLFGPEFGLLDTSTTYRRANFVNTLFLANGGNGIPISNPNRPAGTQVNYSSYQALAGTPQQLVDALNARMMHGTMSAAMNANIVATITAITNANATTQAQQRTQTAIYLIATSSQYQVER